MIIVSTQHSPSYFDQVTMDRTRLAFIKTLQDADKHGRFHAYSPVTTLGRTIIVHAKLTIIDDTLMRIGSANVNNRSLGFDTECDLSLEASGPGSAANRAQITRLRNKILAHWLGCAEAPMEEAMAKSGSVDAGLEMLRNHGYCRLRPIERKPLKPLAAFIAAYHLGDRVGPRDAWRPWKRHAAVAHEANIARKAAAQATPTARSLPNAAPAEAAPPMSVPRRRPDRQRLLHQ